MALIRYHAAKRREEKKIRKATLLCIPVNINAVYYT